MEKIFVCAVSGEVDSEGLSRMPLCMLGTFYKGKQKFSIRRSDIGVLIANMAKRGADVVLDYEHATQFPEVAAGGPIPAAGWIKKIEPEPDADGVVWALVEFTERARQMIEAREIKYVSPVLSWAARDKSTGEQQGITLLSAALTNTPVLDRMPAITLSEAGWVKGEDEQMAGQKVMCADHPQTAMICPDCDPAAMQKLVASEVERERAKAPKVLTLADVKRDGKGRLDLSGLGRDAVIAMSVHEAYEAQQVALSEVEAAVSAGRIAPAKRESFERIALSDIGAFREITKDLRQVDLSERGFGGSGEGATLEQLDSQLDSLARKKMEARGLQYHEAVKLVASEHPDLNRQRTLLMRRKTEQGVH